MKGYLAIILNEKSKATLENMAVHSNVFCHHVTIAFKPDQTTYDKYENLIGERLNFQGVCLFSDKKGQALLVEGILSENESPHVTISCAEGISPIYSNSLIVSEGAQKDVCDIELAGTMQFIKFD